ncbi:MAG: hypothetical protein HYI21_13415 [Sediminibacterium sp. Gen4]|jgi:hypothetical protein|uniref:hypothetical protein n=1 Tax=unclassified Sediminibacterium TaxID=2635961 RepID=UPI0015BDE427|nr:MULTISPECIES: hypothetical protein [unclassified Sediminibacterium]MBW0160975.1 hypothetical protein [Sediminibacterium sp.]MBW0164493.1 hypothetical protein [Sediminibacterium sp.]NWK67023.1 hypothetical protein [Sediminibacterium sp. Gen4]
MAFQSNAQTVTGHWYGIGKVAVPGEHSSYLSELIIKQKGNTVTGELQYYFRDSLFKVKVSGNFNTRTRQLIFKPIPFIYYLSTNTKTGIDCMLTGNFTLLVNRTESVLTGAFESDAAHRYTSPAIQYRFKHSTDTIASKPAVDTTEIDIPTDTISTMKMIERKEISPTMIEPRFLKREKSIFKEIEVTENFLRIDLYDNGTIDHDTVSLYLNHQLLFKDIPLTQIAFRRTIVLDSTIDVNEISMYAENLGTIPPNTAIMIIYDGQKRHELILTSDLDRTATIRLRRK